MQAATSQVLCKATNTVRTSQADVGDDRVSSRAVESQDRGSEHGLCPQLCDGEVPVPQQNRHVFNESRSSNPDEAPALVGRHSAVHGVGDSWWCDDGAHRAQHSHSH